MEPWVHAGKRGRRSPQQQRRNAPRFSLQDYYFPKHDPHLRRGEGRRGQGLPAGSQAGKWFCSACGLPHHNAGLRASRGCGAERSSPPACTKSSRGRVPPFSRLIPVTVT